MILYLIRGAPGSGKSTFATSLWHNNMVDEVYEADHFFLDDNGVYIFEGRLLPNAHKNCQERVLQAMRNGMRIAVANTFTRVWEMQPYLDMAKEFHYQVVVIHMENNFGNIHGVPEDKIKQMKERFEDYG